MKTNKLIFAVIIFLGVSVFFLSCKKESAFSSPDPAINASKNDAAVGEGIDLSVANLPTGSSVDWASSSADNAVIESHGFNGENARAVFNAPGTYTITASLTEEHRNADSTYHHQGIDSSLHHHTDSTYHHEDTDSTPHHETDSTYHHHHNSSTHHHHHDDSAHHTHISIIITIHD